VSFVPEIFSGKDFQLRQQMELTLLLQLLQLFIQDSQTIRDLVVVQIPLLSPILLEVLKSSVLLESLLEGRIKFIEGRVQTNFLIRKRWRRRDGHESNSNVLGGSLGGEESAVLKVHRLKKIEILRKIEKIKSLNSNGKIFQL